MKIIFPNKPNYQPITISDFNENGTIAVTGYGFKGAITIVTLDGMINHLDSQINSLKGEEK